MSLGRTAFIVPDLNSLPCALTSVVYAHRNGHANIRSTLPRANHPDHVAGFVQFTLGGSGIVTEPSGLRTPVPQGHCLVAAMDDELVYEPATEGWTITFATFIGRSAKTWLKELVTLYGHVQQYDLNHHTMKQLIDYGAHGRSTLVMSQHAVTRLASEIFSSLVEWNHPQTNESTDLHTIKHAIKLLTRDLQNPPSIADVAANCGVSREHFTRIFSGAMGSPPHRWLREEQLNQAALLLMSSNKSIKEIAESVGFKSPTTFASTFRAHMGCTPRAFREANRNT